MPAPPTRAHHQFGISDKPPTRNFCGYQSILPISRKTASKLKERQKALFYFSFVRRKRKVAKENASFGHFRIKSARETTRPPAFPKIKDFPRYVQPPQKPRGDFTARRKCELPRKFLRKFSPHFRRGGDPYGQHCLRLLIASYATRPAGQQSAMLLASKSPPRRCARLRVA